MELIIPSIQPPIKVIVTQERYSSFITAFMPDRLDAIGYESNKYEAVCDALVKAGLLEIIDIEELRNQNEKKTVAVTKAIKPL